VAGFGCDERTVAAWEQRAGSHCQHVHEAIVEQGAVDLQHVQADELWVKLVGQRLWLAMAMAVPSRLWLGGVISAKRDKALLQRLVGRVRAAAKSLSAPILVCVDGLAGYVKAFRHGFRRKECTGKAGRPRLVAAAGLLIGQVIKRYEKRRVVSSETRVVQGRPEQIAAVLAASGGGTKINTAYIERLNASFRSRLASLARRGRALLRQDESLTGQVYLVGCLYNFCSEHASLRVAACWGATRTWVEQTPAMAAGLTDHRWSVGELLHYRVAPARWKPPKRRGRRPKVPRPLRWALRPHRVIPT
jgi:transposase-like protein